MTPARVVRARAPAAFLAGLLGAVAAAACGGSTTGPSPQGQGASGVASATFDDTASVTEARFMTAYGRTLASVWEDWRTRIR